MLEFLKTNPAFALLKKDHDTVKDLFDKFETAEDRSAKKKNIDFTSLARTMTERKATLVARGVPAAAEAPMVAGSHGKGDSSAQAADQRTTRAPKTRAAK